MPDREKVIKGLECCMKWTGEPNTATCHCSDCSYTNMDILGQRCLIDLINDALALLKEQKEQKFFVHSDGKITPLPDVVQCKDCIHWDKGHTEECDNLGSICFHNGWCEPDWFCADGERRDETT